MNVCIKVKKDLEKYSVDILIENAPEMHLQFMPYGRRLGLVSQYAGFCEGSMNMGKGGVQISEGVKLQGCKYRNFESKSDACSYARKTMKNIKAVYKDAKATGNIIK